MIGDEVLFMNGWAARIGDAAVSRPLFNSRLELRTAVLFVLLLV